MIAAPLAASGPRRRRTRLRRSRSLGERLDGGSSQPKLCAMPSTTARTMSRRFVVERHVHEAAAHFARPARCERAVEPRQEQHAARAGLGRAAASCRAVRTDRRRGGRRARRSRTRRSAGRARAPCRRARSPRRRRSGRRTVPASRTAGDRGRRGSRRRSSTSTLVVPIESPVRPGVNAPPATATVAVSFVPAYTIVVAGTPNAVATSGSSGPTADSTGTSCGSRESSTPRELHEIVVVRASRRAMRLSHSWNMYVLCWLAVMRPVARAVM